MRTLAWLSFLLSLVGCAESGSPAADQDDSRADAALPVQAHEARDATVVEGAVDAEREREGAAQDAGSDTGIAASCPAGPSAPGGVCRREDLVCTYGYEPAACGGTTVICMQGLWRVQSHSQPSPDAGCPPQFVGMVSNFPISHDGEPCVYEAPVAGSIKITMIEDTLHDERCKASTQKRIWFAFTPTGASEPTGGDRLSLQMGIELPEVCLASEGLKLGATFPATAAKKTMGGPCQPVVYDFKHEFPSCVAACGPQP